jgi:aspergillopepsin I
VSSQFASDANNDGLVGLAFSNINTVTPTAQKTFFDTVKSSLSSALFAADLKKGAAGSYDFGVSLRPSA